jgi:hypothetical protein
MTNRWRRFDNGFERFRARLIVVLSITLFSAIAQAQQLPTANNRQQTTPERPTQSPSQNAGLRRIQAVHVSDTIKIDGVLNESAWTLSNRDLIFVRSDP